MKTAITASASAALLLGAALAPLPAASASSAAATVLTARLRPSGDADGSGSATVRLKPGTGTVCARITWTAIQTPMAAHIHRRSDGRVMVDLTGAVTGGNRCTAGVAKGLLRDLREHPRRFSVNVHNATYPAGAIQGTLHR